MGVFIGYYESGTKKILWSVHVSFLHVRSLKTSPVLASFRVKKYDWVRYRNRTFQKFESVLYRIMMFTYEANQYNLYQITFCTTSWGGSGLITAGVAACMRNIPGATSLIFVFNPFLKHETGL